MAREEDVSDLELVRRSASGDAEAYGTLMSRHQDRVFGLALRMLGNRTDALDATQDAFISAYRQAAAFRGEAAFGTWLYRIAVNACNDFARKRSRWDLQDEQDQAPDPARSRIEEDVTTRMEVSAALARLPEEYRTAVVMHDLGGIPYEEIATLTGTIVGTVKSRISRGRRRLAELLEQDARLDSSKGTT